MEFRRLAAVGFIVLAIAPLATGTEPPPAPKSVVAAGIQPLMVEVMWVPGGGAAAYNVYAITYSDDVEYIDTTSSTSLTVVGDYKEYAVTAVDTLGVESDMTYSEDVPCVGYSTSPPNAWVHDCSFAGAQISLID